MEQHARTQVISGTGPDGVSPVLAQFASELGKALPPGMRDRLRPHAARMGGTAGDGLDEARRFGALDWLVRAWAPEWLGLGGLAAEARRLRDLPRIGSLASAEAA